MPSNFVGQLTREHGCWVVDLYELPQVFAPTLRLVCAPWYDAETDGGELAFTALCILHQARDNDA